MKDIRKFREKNIMPEIYKSGYHGLKETDDWNKCFVTILGVERVGRLQSSQSMRLCTQMDQQI